MSAKRMVRIKEEKTPYEKTDKSTTAYSYRNGVHPAPVDLYVSSKIFREDHLILQKADGYPHAAATGEIWREVTRSIHLTFLRIIVLVYYIPYQNNTPITIHKHILPSDCN